MNQEFEPLFRAAWIARGQRYIAPYLKDLGLVGLARPHHGARLIRPYLFRESSNSIMTSYHRL